MTEKLGQQSDGSLKEGACEEDGNGMGEGCRVTVITHA